MTTANPPIETVRMGAIKAAIWRNVSEDGRVRFGVSFERTYRDANGEWKSSEYYGRDECLLLAKVADRAHTRIVELLEDERARDRESGDDQGNMPSESHDRGHVAVTAHEGR